MPSPHLLLAILIAAMTAIGGAAMLAQNTWDEPAPKEEVGQQQAEAPAEKSDSQAKPQEGGESEIARSAPAGDAGSETADDADGSSASLLSQTGKDAIASLGAGTAELPDERGLGFDVVRVEPSGEALFAGRAKPNAAVEIVSNGSVIATAVADRSGSFVVMPEKPLAPGGHDLSLRLAGESGQEAEERVAVVVPEREGDDVLVVAEKPGEPSQILEKPSPDTSAENAEADEEAPAGGEPSEQEVAGAAPPTGTQQEPRMEDDPSEAPADATPAEVEETAVASAETVAPPAGEEGSPSQAEEAAASGSEDAQETAPAAPAETAAAQPSDASTPRPAPSGDGAASAPETEVAKTQAPASDAEAGPDEQQLAVEAVEEETGRMYVAGAGKPGSTVRVYVDETPLGEAKVNEGGRWLVESPREIEEGEVSVRADQLETGGTEVAARSEVAFSREANEAALVPLAGDASVTASGNIVGPRSIIIRRGDNLWTLSRRNYGRGIRYTTIYTANQDQIRDPDLIYPGQVFTLPTRDKNWPQETEGEG